MIHKNVFAMHPFIRPFIFLIFLFVSTLLSGQTSLTSAVNFSVKDVNGDSIRLFDILDEGKYVLIEFSATSCYPCQQNAAWVDQAYRYFGCNGGELFVMGVNQGGDHFSVLSYGLQYGIGYPLVSGNDGGGNGVFSAYGIPSSPCLILISPSKIIMEQNIIPVNQVLNLLISYGLDEMECGSSLLADFSINPPAIPVGDSLQVSDQSSGAISNWFWRFPGGEPDSSMVATPPWIVYPVAGNYEINLRIGSSVGSKSKSRIVHIYPPGAPIVDFEADATEIFQGDTVFFTDLSSGNPIAWDWTFVGATPFKSNLQSPPGIVYPLPGNFNVYLTASNASGMGYHTKAFYIKVKAADPPVEYCDTISNLLPFDSLMVLNINGGVIPGNNNLGVLEYADRFANPMYDRLKGLIIPVELAQSNFADAKIRFKVWDGDQQPGAVLGSKDVKMNLLTPNFFYLLQFNPPVPLDGDFFVGYQLSGNGGDQFAVSLTKDRGPGAPSSLYLRIGNEWINIDQIPLLGGMTSALGIMPVVCNLTGMGDGLEEEGEWLVFPNPTTGTFYISRQSPGKLVIEVWDSFGRMVKSVQSGDEFPELNLNNQSPGLYFVRIIHSRGMAVSRILLTD